MVATLRRARLRAAGRWHGGRDDSDVADRPAVVRPGRADDAAARVAGVLSRQSSARNSAAMADERVHVRDAMTADAEAIADLHAASWRTTYRGAMRDAYLDGDVATERRAVWRARLVEPAPNQHVLVAEIGERLVGFACAYGAADPRWGTELDNLHVRAGEQGRGVGADLLTAVARWTRTMHPDGALYLWVLDGNVGARRFYDRHGGRDAEGDHWHAPDGSALAVRRYLWPVDAVARLASRA